MPLRELRVALRSLMRHPAYAVVALMTFVLGIGASVGVFAIVDAVLLSPLPYPQSGRLMQVYEVNAHGQMMPVAWPNFADWRDATTRFERMAAYNRGGETTVLGTGEPLRVSVTGVSEGFFRTLGIEPALGRLLLPEDHRPGVEPVAVVSDGFWRTRLGADRDLDRHPLTVSGLPVRVVGVMPPKFRFPRGIEIWYPIELTRSGSSRTAHNFRVVGRLASGATIAQADGELDAVTRRIAEESPEATEDGSDEFFASEATVVPLRDVLVGDMRRPLWILMGAALLVLLVACTNLASTALARGTGREHELAVRHALGAGRARLLGAAFGEVAVLSGAGAMLGLVVGWLVVRALPAIAPADLPRAAEVRLDPRVVAFTVVLSGVAAILAGLLPALRVSSAAVQSLRTGARGSSDRRRRRVWKWLIASETALALVLLVGAGLLLRSFVSVLRVDPGYRTKGLLTVTVSPPSPKYDDLNARRAYYQSLEQRITALPGVETVGLIGLAPMDGPPNGLVAVRGGPSATVTGEYQIASAGAFRALGVPLLAGRLFDEADAEDGAHVVVVNQAFAQMAWPGEDPIGKRMTGGGMDDYWDQDLYATVIGEVGDMRQTDFTAPPYPTFYFSYRQRPFRSWTMTAVIRPVGGPPEALAPTVRRVVREVDPDVPMQIETMRDRVADALSARRFLLGMVLGFAAVALVLAGVGVYGVVAYAVERRRREIGIRLAIGAEPRSVRRAIQGEYMMAAGLGAGVGVLLSLAFTRLLGSLLFHVRSSDPGTFVAVLAVIGFAAWVSSYLSALRGTRVDPMETMRAE